MVEEAAYISLAGGVYEKIIVQRHEVKVFVLLSCILFRPLLELFQIKYFPDVFDYECVSCLNKSILGWTSFILRNQLKQDLLTVLGR